MGFNPFRKHRASAVDIAIVVGFAAITLGFVLWAILSG